MRQIKRVLRRIILNSFLSNRLRAEELKKFRGQFEDFQQLSELSQPRFEVSWKNSYPSLKDDTVEHNFDRHYIYHTAWAARKLKEIAPEHHIDISSSLYFCSITSAFVPITFYDYRKPRLELDNLQCEQANLLNLPFSDESIPSLSCMHVVEHIGLGRYGDSLNPDGDLQAMSELARVLSPDGNLLFVVPVGKPLLQFNSHRIYSFEQIIQAFPSLLLVEFSLIPDDKKKPLIINVDPKLVNDQDYGCGCFWFKKEE